MPVPHRPPGALRIIVTADDFGLAPAVNAAVIKAHRTGTLTSASLMVAEPSAAQAVALARETPTLRVGLHVVVVDGKTSLPRDQVASIVDATGRLSSRLGLAGFRYFGHPTARRQLRAEVRAQFEAFRATGLALDHVDTHRHMILHPVVLDAIVSLASEFHIRAVRLPAEPWHATRGLPIAARIAAAVRIVSLAPWLALVRRRLRRAGIAHNAEVRGLADTGRMDEQAVLRLIPTVDCDATEFFFHPAMASPGDAALPQPAARHLAELDALCSAAVRGALDRAGLQRVGYGDLVSGSVG